MKYGNGSFILFKLLILSIKNVYILGERFTNILGVVASGILTFCILNEIGRSICYEIESYY